MAELKLINFSLIAILCINISFEKVTYVCQMIGDELFGVKDFESVWESIYIEKLHLVQKIENKS